VGEVAGDAQRRGADTYARPVKWTKRVARDGITVGTRNTLGAILTVFRLNSDASREMASRCVAINANPDVSVVMPPEVPEVEDGPSVEDVVADALEKSREFVEDRIASLEAYEMQDLVAGILRALGYKTQVAGPGSDRGVDIFASPDGLGLEEPRIFVEVKHRPNSSMGTQEVRSFMGGRQQGDRCLFVSTGGFSREARYEAERSNVPLKLIGLPQLRELLVEHYEEVDAETKRLVPLVKTYWPAASD
ncbi:MAG: restriction endonuclease, partial [Planctomycetota bacterium]|nr:restriction endonuclease [Planctomycetota bacterium]